MTNEAFVTEWVIDTVKEKYADDIALIVSHATLRIDDSEKVISYFVPITERGEQFAQTFILEGVGHDIWGIPWERLENFAKLEEYNITVLADAEVLYARSPKDRERFENLQKEQAERLSNPKIMRACALRAFEQAKNIYLQTLFATRSDVKAGAGYVIDYLAQAIAFSNHSYFKKSQTNQLHELSKMRQVPDGFAKLYRSVILQKEEEKQKKLCYEIICLVQSYLSEISPVFAQERKTSEANFQDLADWYAELSYTWLRIRHYAQANDAVKVYMWGIFLQKECDAVCEDFGLGKLEIMRYFNAEDLTVIARKADEAEQYMRDAIGKGGGKIREYATREEFLYEV